MCETTKVNGYNQPVNTTEDENTPKKISVLPSTVINAFNQYFKLEYDSLINYIVFDPQASYETSIAAVRAAVMQKNKSNKPNKNDKVNDSKVFPFISWNRNPLQKTVLSNQKVVSQKVLNELTGLYVNFKGGVSDVNYNFTLYTKNPIDMERFEVEYITGNGKYFSDLVNMKISINGLGDFNYNLFWNNIESNVFNIENDYYQSLSCSVTICGLFFTVEETDDSDVIDKIIFEIGNCCGILDDSDKYIIQAKMKRDN